MSKYVAAFFVGFAFVSLCGLLVALAGGVQWGTVDCGFITGMTMFVAIFAGGGLAALMADISR